ncbi:MAG: sodium:proton exchanger, partial [Thiotrichales bacterium]
KQEFFNMHPTDGLVPELVGSFLVILIIGLILRRFKQPHVVSYLIAGIVLGPDVFGMITNQDTLNNMGNFGVILLLFFIGMEVSLGNFLKNWRTITFSTLLQFICNISIVYVCGHFLGWSLGRCLLLSFTISLSSTAVVIKILQDWKEIDTPIGQKVIGVLILQDIALVPIILILTFVGKKSIDVETAVLQITGAILLATLLIFALVKGKVKFPYASKLKQDHELQIFAAFVACFGLAFLSSLFYLSAALGAFVAGILVSSAKETDWVTYRMEPFRVVFVALFFVSIGMMLDLRFAVENFLNIAAVVCAVFLINSIMMAIIFRCFGGGWYKSFYAAALLSQMGEFGFVLLSTGKQLHFVDYYHYKLLISVIAITLMLSPLWIGFVRKYKIKAEQNHETEVNAVQQISYENKYPPKDV